MKKSIDDTAIRRSPGARRATFLLVAALATGGMCVRSSASGDVRENDHLAGFALRVTPEWVDAHRAGLALVDVRSKAKYLWSHVPGAVNVGWKTFSDPGTAYPGNLNPDAEAVAGLLGGLGLSSSRPVVIYSDPKNNWGEEGRMFWMLEVLGHDRVAVMDGGFPRWTGEHRPVARGPETPTPASFEPGWRSDRLIGWEELLGRLGDPELVIVDSRTRAEFRGATPYGEVRGGHIPGARNLPWDTFLEEDGALASPERIRQVLSERGVPLDREAAVYCTGGVRSGFLYFILRLAGHTRPRNYDGSFWEWTARPELPVELP